jgi:hypothetical protein
MPSNYFSADICLCLFMNESRGPTYRLEGRDHGGLILLVIVSQGHHHVICY